MSTIAIVIAIIIIMFVFLFILFGMAEKFTNREGYRPGRRGYGRGGYGPRGGRWGRWGRWSRWVMPTYWFQPVTTIYPYLGPYQTAEQIAYLKCKAGCAAAGGTPAEQASCNRYCNKVLA